MKPLGVGACLVAGLALSAGTASVDACRYASDAAAQAVWQPMRGSSAARVATVDGAPALRLNCNFAGTTF